MRETGQGEERLHFCHNWWKLTRLNVQSSTCFVYNAIFLILVCEGELS